MWNFVKDDVINNKIKKNSWIELSSAHIQFQG